MYAIFSIYFNFLKMKKSLILAAVALLCVACSNESELTQVENHVEKGLTPVTVRMTNFSITKEEMSSGGGTTRAAVDPANYSGIGALTLAFYDAQGTEVLKKTQVNADANTYTTFGEFVCNLTAGTYTMVALGYYYHVDDVFVLTSPTQAAFTSEKPRETFCKTQSVTVPGTTALNVEVTLERISAKLELHSTEVCPEGTTKIRKTYKKGGKTFNPTTGLALDDNGFTQTQNPHTDSDGKLSVSSYPFLSSDEETIDITIEALDNDNNVLITKEVKDVPFQRNCKTTVTGAIFTPLSTLGIKLETDWGTEKVFNF